MENEVEFQKLEGNIDLFTINSMNEETCSHINNTMDEQEKDDCVKYIFDLQHLKLVNSHFIGLLAKRHYDLTKKGGRIAILNAPDVVKKMFKIFGLLDTFQFHTDMKNAVKSFN